MKTNHINSSWGNSIKTYPKIYRPENIKEIIKIIKKKKNFTIQGNGRSYGDVSLNFENLIKTEKLTKILNFDKKNGIIEVESGLLLVDLLKIILPLGWFIPVTPGTKYVSIGGMVANNVHGKNVKKNQLKYYISQIK
ncbi:MAG TPA: FAD-binding protein, partial [Candidatus Pelagibacter bacterium]|nr:FAD-binding protein [Candidatus Pelagibacter bacterium]